MFEFDRTAYLNSLEKDLGYMERGGYPQCQHGVIIESWKGELRQLRVMATSAHAERDEMERIERIEARLALLGVAAEKSGKKMKAVAGGVY